MIGCRVGLIVGSPDSRRSSSSFLSTSLALFVLCPLPVKYRVTNRPGSVVSIVRCVRSRRQTVLNWNCTIAGTRLCTALYTNQHLGPNSTTRTPATDMLYNTTNGDHQRTSSQQFCNKFATSQCQSPTSRHVKMLGCGKFVSVGGEFVVQQVVELL